MNSDIIIRLATYEDIEAMTELHWASFKPEDHVAVIFGKSYIKSIYKWIVQGKDAYALVAEENGKVIGLVSVCDRPYFASMFKACLLGLIFSILKKPILLFNKRIIDRLFHRSKSNDQSAKKILHFPGVAQVMFGAVDANSRGKGIYVKLNSSTKEFSRLRGSRAILGEVYRDNLSVRRVKDKDGWVEVPELETSSTVVYAAFLDNSIARELGLDRLVKNNNTDKEKQSKINLNGLQPL